MRTTFEAAAKITFDRERFTVHAHKAEHHGDAGIRVAPTFPDLAERWPVQVVRQWIGNSPQVAAKHYLQVTEGHYSDATKAEKDRAEKCAENCAVERETTLHGDAEGPTGGGHDNTNTAKTPEFCTSLQSHDNTCTHADDMMVGPAGLEPATSGL